MVSMTVDLDELDAAGLLAASSAAVRVRRLAEVEDLLVLAQWAALHSADPTDPASRADRPRTTIDVYPFNEHEGGQGHQLTKQLPWLRALAGLSSPVPADLASSATTPGASS